MKTVSAKTNTEINKDTTVIIYIAEINLAGITLRLSSGGVLNWNGLIWSGDLYMIEPPRNESGERVAVIELSNMDDSAAAIILSGPVRNQPVTIWSLHGLPPYAFDDAEQELIGVISGIPGIGQRRATLNVRGSSGRQQFSPRRAYRNPVYNYLPEPGTKIIIDGIPITINARS